MFDFQSQQIYSFLLLVFSVLQQSCEKGLGEKKWPDQSHPDGIHVYKAELEPFPDF